MPTIRITKDTLNQIIDIDPGDIGHPDFRLKLAKPTGKTFEDGLIEEWVAVFAWEDGKTYRVRYRQVCAHAMSQGDYIGFFDHLPSGPVECTEVVPKQVTTIVYEDAE